MYISEKGFNNLVETYVELFESVNRLENDLRNIGRCLDNIERDNKEKIEKESSWYSNKCNYCTCEDDKEEPKSVVAPTRESFNKGVKIIPTKTMDKPDPKPNTNPPGEFEKRKTSIKKDLTNKE